MDKLKIGFISDTHGLHWDIKLPDVDIVICCGDITMSGTKSQVEDFMDWYASQPIKHKILIAGNHDFWFDINHPKSINYNKDDNSYLNVIPEGITYLQDSDVTIEGIKIWGSPVTPYFYNWAFNMLPENLVGYWDKIPLDTDIIVTHGPPFGTNLDKCKNGYNAGCKSLQQRILEVVPKVCAFGHIHEGYGQDEVIIDDSIVKLINCSVLNYNYKVNNDPIVIEWDL